MKNHLKFLTVAVLTTILAACASEPNKPTTEMESARTSLTYHDLALKDLDQMVHYVSRKIAESKAAETDKVAPLRVGLRSVYSRPDDDEMIEKIIGPLRNEIEEVDSWESVMSGLVNDAIGHLQNPGSQTPAEQFTQVVFLNNVIAQNRPEARKNGLGHDLIQRIYDANLSISKQARNEGQLRLMKGVVSPSELAGKVLGKGKLD